MEKYNLNEIMASLDEINNSVLSLSSNKSFIISISSLILAFIAIIIAFIIFKKQQRNGRITEIIILISSFDLVYYSLFKHHQFWKDKNPIFEEERQKFWARSNLTENIINLNKIVTLSKFSLNQQTFLKVYSFTEYLANLIAISSSGVDQSKKDYSSKSIIDNEGYKERVADLISVLSKQIGFKTHNEPKDEETEIMIKNLYFL